MTNTDLHDATQPPGRIEPMPIPQPRSFAVDKLINYGKDFASRPSTTFLSLPSVGQLLFAQGNIIAAVTGDVIYIPDALNIAANTRRINELMERLGAPVVRLAPANFDFTVGAMLTKVGLMLTTMPRSEP
jgi:hypothetical protein